MERKGFFGASVILCVLLCVLAMGVLVYSEYSEPVNSVELETINKIYYDAEEIRIVVEDDYYKMIQEQIHGDLQVGKECKVTMIKPSKSWDKKLEMWC